MESLEREIYGPFAFGQSPYRVKGLAYLGLRDSFDKRVPGGMRGVVARIGRTEVEAFFEQHFLPSSTYDILPLIEASQTAARICGVPWREFVRVGSRLQAERDLNGVYRAFLRLATPKLVVDRIPRILMQYMTFGAVEGQMTAPRRFEGVSRGLPRPVAPWMLAIAEGFVPILLETAGAKDAALLSHPPTVEEGSGAGLEHLTTRFSVSWV